MASYNNADTSFDPKSHLYKLLRNTLHFTQASNTLILSIAVFPVEHIPFNTGSGLACIPH